jgi:hypothetical protein
MPKEKTPQKISPELVSQEEWSIYEAAMQSAREANIPFMVGGAFALGVYTGRWRPTKDVDLLILPKDRHAMIDALTRTGFKDYYDQLGYDRGWIYRSTRDNYIVDVIWRMANRRADVDEAWFDNAPSVCVRDEIFKIVPPEELLWHKLYVLQRDRCDWPDVFNLLYSVSGKIDWKYLLNRMEDDLPLLKGVLNVFGWLCPGKIRELPKWVREQFQLADAPPDAPPAVEKNVSFFDSREWFVGVSPNKNVLGR